MKRVLLVRHGECEMNLRVKTHIGGQSNSSPLTPLGRAQAAALGAYLASMQPALATPVLSSTAVRAQDTAAIMVQAWADAGGACGDSRLPQVVAMPELLELGQGEWVRHSRHMPPASYS